MGVIGRETAAQKYRLAVLVLAAGLALAAGPANGQSREADLDDLAILLPTINDALETARSGDPVTWFNPKTGNRGEIEVLRTFFRADEIPCREYERMTERPDSSSELVQGTGCRTEPGFWTLEESASRVIRPPRTTESAKAPATVERPAAVEETVASPREVTPPPSKPKDILPPLDKAAAPPAPPRKAPLPEPDSKPPEIVARLPQPAAE